LNDNQYGGLVSFVYNIGYGEFSSSTLLKRLNYGFRDAVPAELARWVHVTMPDGTVKISNGLVKRRAQEIALLQKDCGQTTKKGYEESIQARRMVVMAFQGQGRYASDNAEKDRPRSDL
jgi:Phage lysozyme